MKTFALRLHPGDDLLIELQKYSQEMKIKAGFVATCVGSLRQANLRMANQPEATKLAGKFEIVSLVGTLSRDGLHLHISISDSIGKMTGGHLLTDNLIYTTAEIIIGELEDVVFERKIDPETTYDELVVEKI